MAVFVLRANYHPCIYGERPARPSSAHPMRVRGSQRRDLVPPAPSPPHGPSATLPTVALASIPPVKPPSPRAIVAVAAAIPLLLVLYLCPRAPGPLILC